MRFFVFVVVMVMVVKVAALVLEVRAVVVLVCFVPVLRSAEAWGLARPPAATVACVSTHNMVAAALRRTGVVL